MCSQGITGLLQTISTITLAGISFVILVQTRLLEKFNDLQKEDEAKSLIDKAEKSIKRMKRVRPWLLWICTLLFAGSSIWLLILYLKI